MDRKYISLYLSISLSLPLLAIAVNFFRTVSTRIEENKVIYSLISFSFGIFVITNIFQIVSSLSNIIPILSLTNFEIAIRYGYVFSAILITISFVYYLIPKIFGREVKFSRLESLTSFLLKLVVSLTLFSNALIGIISGYSWNAGANAGNPTIYGEGFGLLWSTNQHSFNPEYVFIFDITFAISVVFHFSRQGCSKWRNYRSRNN